MLRVLVGTSIRFRLLVIGLAGLLLLAGATQLQSARVDILPEFTPTYVEVQTEALGLSAEEVEELITVPLEADLLHGVAFLQEIRSQSIAGLSSVVLIFEPGTDTYEARQVVAERLTQAHALPNVSRPPVMLQPLSSLSRFMIVGLSSDDHTVMEMSVLARWNIRPRLMGVPGVANVSIFGQQERQLQVLVDPAELARNNVTLEHIVETSGNALWFSPLTFLEASTPGTGGFIDTPQQRLGIQHILPIRSAEDLAEVAIDTGPDRPTLRLGDVATVIEDHQPLIGDGLVGDGAGLVLVIEKFPDVNTLDVTRDVEAALDDLAPGLTGIQIDSTIFREANFLRASIDNVALAILIAVLLIAVILGALLFDWRAMLISLLTIPLSVAAAAVVLNLAGASINALTVAGLLIAIGVVIDDATGLVDDVRRRLATPTDGDQGRSTAEIVVEAVVHGRGPLVYASVIVLVALVPLLFVSGAVSAFLPSMAIAYAIALGASMLVAVTVAPALAVLILVRDPEPRRESPLLRRARAAYHRSLTNMLHRMRPSLLPAGAIVVGVAVVFGLAVASTSDDSALPTFRQRDLLIHWDGAPGASRTAMVRIASRAGAELRAIPGVRNVGAHVGRALLSDQRSSVDQAEIWVSIDPTADYDDTLAAIESTVAGYPGLDRAVTTYTADRIDQVLGSTDRDVAVRVYGQDLSILEARAEEVRGVMAQVDGIDAPAVETTVMEPTIEIEVDLDAAARFGVKAGDVRRAATSLLSGIEVGSLFEDQKVFEVVVWGKPELRNSLSSVENLLIETPNAGLVRLDDVADVQIRPSPSVVRREGVMRYVDVTGDIAGRDVSAVLADLRTRLTDVPFELEYHAEVHSGALERQEARNQLLAVIAGALVVMLLLLQAAFGSWRLAALILLALPAAALGGALATLATGDLVSVGSLAGLMTVGAITARHAVSLVDRYRQLERAGEEAGVGVALAGAQERLAPTLVTALGTAAFALPFIVLGDVAGLEIMRPMAVFVLGSLVSSTLLLLFILPSIYLRSGPSPASETEALLSEPPAFEPTPA